MGEGVKRMSGHSKDTQGQCAPSEAFVTQLTAAQGNLYAYVCTLLGGTQYAADVLQETNLVLWRKASEFDIARDFNAWARRFAYLQVMAHREKQARERHVSNFSAEALSKIAARLESCDSDFVQRTRLLDECIKKLSAYQRELVHLRYAERLEVKAISQQMHTSQNNIAAALYRARLSLIDCVETSPESRSVP
jgi:RNA polymerase sigma-70 factor, ECF subfamily